MLTNKSAFAHTWSRNCACAETRFAGVNPLRMRCADGSAAARAWCQSRVHRKRLAHSYAWVGSPDRLKWCFNWKTLLLGAGTAEEIWGLGELTGELWRTLRFVGTQFKDPHLRIAVLVFFFSFNTNNKGKKSVWSSPWEYITSISIEELSHPGGMYL